MQTTQAFFMRDDTLFGVCHALGEDFGFNPLYLRMTLGVLLLWNPTIVVSAYLGAGLLVVISRLIAPNPRAAVQPDQGAEVVEAAPQGALGEPGQDMALAA